MKTKLVLFTIVCLLLGLTTSAVAQSDAIRALHQQATIYASKQNLLSQWSEGNMDSIVNAIIHGGGMEALGISKEQSEKILGYHSDPEVLSIHRELVRLLTEIHGGAFADNLSEETQKKYIDLLMELDSVRQKKANDLINETLTPDQRKKIREFQIATMDESALVSPGMFEVLDISDEQKKQLEEVKKALKPEVEKHIDKMVEHESFYRPKVNEAIGDKLNDVTDPAERMKIISEVLQKFNEQYPGYSQGTTEYLESGKTLSNNLKIKMFDVLTDEQWERMLGLIDNPPDHVKKYFEIQRRIMGINTSQDDGGWQPGPDSWRPGDAIPGAYRIERETRSRFPRGEN